MNRESRLLPRLVHCVAVCSLSLPSCLVLLWVNLPHIPHSIVHVLTYCSHLHAYNWHYQALCLYTMSMSLLLVSSCIEVPCTHSSAVLIVYYCYRSVLYYCTGNILSLFILGRPLANGYYTRHPVQYKIKGRKYKMG